MKKNKNISPDGNYILSFRYIGDIRFGPSFFRMKINNYIVKDMYFARNFVWSADSRYLAVQKWIELDPHNGPHTSIFLMDMKRDVWTDVAPTYKGLVSPVRLTKDYLVYSKEYIAPGLPPYFEERKRMEDIREWVKMEYFEPPKDKLSGISNGSDSQENYSTQNETK